MGGRISVTFEDDYSAHLHSLMKQRSNCGKCKNQSNTSESSKCVVCQGTNMKLRNMEQNFIRAKQIFDLDKTLENLETMAKAWRQYRMLLFSYLAEIYDNLDDDSFKIDTYKYANLQKELIDGYRYLIKSHEPTCSIR